MHSRYTLFAAALSLIACTKREIASPGPELAIDPDMAEFGLATVTDSTGIRTRFSANEIVMVSADAAKADALAHRHGGEIIDSVAVGSDTYFRIRVALDHADVGTLRGDLAAIGKSSDRLVASDNQTLALLAIVAAEQRADPSVRLGVNYASAPMSVRSGETHEAGTGPQGYVSDAFKWPYMKDHHVPEAWQLLETAGKTSNKVKLMIMDTGFVRTNDWPANVTIFPANAWKQPNTWSCTGDSSCPWHGTETVEAAAGLVDNSYGGAGPGAPVVDLVVVQSPTQNLFSALLYLTSTVTQSLQTRPRIVNISAGLRVPASLAFTTSPMDALAVAMRANGILLISAAGNDGQNVDSESCFIGCWEDAVHVPCELDGVLCVAGLGGDGKRHPNSNYGADQRSRYRELDDPSVDDNSVDLYAPYVLYAGATPDAQGNIPNTGATTISGTSFSGPFVAGIAALVMAANPALSVDEIYAILIDTAFSTNDYALGVDAAAAVKAALLRAGNSTPSVHIVSPASGAFVEASIVGTDLTAEAKDVEEGDISSRIHWTSSLDGDLGTGAAINAKLTTKGAQTITATVTDNKGASHSDSSLMILIDASPAVSIIRPEVAPFAGIATILLAKAVDDLADLCLSPNAVTWTSDNPADLGFPQQGCAPTVTFASVGARTLTVTAVNGYGTIGTASKTVTVIAAPSAPVVQFVTPTPNGSAWLGDVLSVGLLIHAQAPFTVTLRWGNASDFYSTCPVVTTLWGAPLPPDGVPNYGLDWDTETIRQAPGACGPGGNGVLAVTISDANGFGSDGMSFSVTAPPF